MYRGGGFGRRPPIAQTRFSDVIESSSLEIGWGVATASSVFLNIFIIVLKLDLVFMALLKVLPGLVRTAVRSADK